MFWEAANRQKIMKLTKARFFFDDFSEDRQRIDGMRGGQRKGGES